MIDINYFIKTNLLFIFLFSISTTSFSQTNNRFEVLITNGYSNFIREHYKPEGTYKGNYANGIAFRYLGKKKKIFRPTIGFSYSNLSQIRTVKNSSTFSTDFQQAIHYHIISIPYQLVLEKNDWRGGLEIAFESPFYLQDVYRRIDDSDQLGSRSRSGYWTKLLVHWGFGFGAFFGKNLKAKNGQSFFVEVQFKTFDVIRPFEAHDNYLMNNIFPYWIGLNIGKRF